MASYPGALKSFTNVVDGTTEILATQVNQPYDEIEAIQAELGTDPAGSYATVKARLTGLASAPATFVAASDASASALAYALASGGYVCDGTADNVQIQAAIDALPAAGGKVVLSEGLFTVTASITLSSDQALEGQGQVATEIFTTTNGLDVLQIHGADVANKISGVYVANLRLGSNAVATSDGISLRYCNRNIFENLEIVFFNGHGLHIAGSHDNRWSNIYVSNCGHTANSLPAVYLENLADQDVNAEHFKVLHIEPWRYEALEIGAVNGTKVAHYNQFFDSKIHGDGSAPGIVVKGERNVFCGLLVTRMEGQTAIQIDAAADSNQFRGVVVGNAGLIFDIDGDHNVVAGVTGNGGGSKVIDDGFDIAGDETTISHVNLVKMHGWGFTISGNTNQIGLVNLESIDEAGFIISGDENVLVACSPEWVGLDAGEACVVTGDENHIIGGKYDGPGNKTITFAGGANDNRVIGAQVTKAITDAGAGNQFWAVQGYTPSGSVVSIKKVIDHADIVDDGGASGHEDFDDTIPAGSIIKAVKLDFTEAFNSDDTTTLKVKIGPQADDDDFSKTATPGDEAFNTTTDDYWGESACQDSVVVSAAAPRITFTEDNDITHIISGGNAQGAVTITITYMKA